MDLDDLLEEFKDEQSQAKKKQAMLGKHTLAQQDSATFSTGPAGEHPKQGGAKGKQTVNEDPWGDIPQSIQSTNTHGGLAPPVNKQLYAQQSAGTGWDDSDDAAEFGGGSGAQKGYSMTPNFGHEISASGQSHRVNASK
jgi:hypothetical protein